MNATFDSMQQDGPPALTFTLLRLLADGDFHSGEVLARQLGISRASVNNALANAGGYGLALHSVRGRGYRLAQPFQWLDAAAIGEHLGSAGKHFQIEIHKNLKAKSDRCLKPIKENLEKTKIPFKTVVKTGRPGFVICNYAETNNVDLIVMPVYDRVWTTIVTGYTAETIFKHSPKPVLFVREASRDILMGRTMLVVDDEPDILDTMEEELDMCIVHKAKTAEAALECIGKNRYDIVILDIMGVDGFRLLEHTVKNYIPTVMLTAHALSKESLQKSGSSSRPNSGGLSGLGAHSHSTAPSSPISADV